MNQMQTVFDEHSCTIFPSSLLPFALACAFTEYGWFTLTVLCGYVNQRCLNWSLCSYICLCVRYLTGFLVLSVHHLWKVYIIGIIVLELTYITFSEWVSLIALFHKVHLIKESTHPLCLLPTGLITIKSIATNFLIYCAHAVSSNESL